MHARDPEDLQLMARQKKEMMDVDSPLWTSVAAWLRKHGKVRGNGLPVGVAHNRSSSVTYLPSETVSAQNVKPKLEPEQL